VKLVRSKFFPFIIIFVAVLIYYLPVLIKPSLILERGNDLDGFFWPIYYYTKTHLLLDKALPLWNNLFLAGTPLLPDPQAPLFYPLNIFALLLPLNFFFVLSFMLHSFIAGLAMYLCAKCGFKFSSKTSIFLALLYLVTPKLAGYMQAGHVGLVNSLAWIPLAIYAALKLRQTPKIKYSILLAVSLALVYFSHLPTFLIVSLGVGLLSITKRSVFHLTLAVILVFGLTSVSLLPQMEWQKVSTRYLLLQDKDVYPKWKSITEPLMMMFVPWANGVDNLQKIDSEKWIALGILPTLLAAIGFSKLKRKFKLLTLLTAGVIFLIILNNASPIYSILLNQNWYLLLRVSTRFWILIIPIVLYLIGLVLEKNKSKLIFLVAFLAIVESILLGWIYLQKPTFQDDNLAPKEVYEYLAKDKSLFKVFCLTRCLSQKEAAIYNLRLLDGYSTVQQKNFNQEAWQLTGAYWNYYTLSIPPLGTFSEKIKPDPKSLGEYNVKYIISPYKLVNLNFLFKTTIGKFYIYENKLYHQRTDAPITIYTPNLIRVDTVNFKGNQIILSEVYSPGWKAFLNGEEEVAVQETPNALMAVDIKTTINFIEFRYHPLSFDIGKYLTLATILFIIGYAIYQKTRKN
jgi:hypothetical protein